MNFGHNPILLLVTLAGLLLLTGWVYRHTVPDVGRKKFALGLLRFAALGTIVFLLFRPSVQSVQEVQYPPVLAVLIDNSESVGVTGPQSDSTDSIRRILSTLPLDKVPGELRIYGFGSEVIELNGPNAYDSLLFDQQRTNVSSALDFIRDDLQDDNLGAVLLVSDGRHNTGRNPLFVAERFPAPVYTVVVGDTTVKRDLLIDSIISNDIGYVNTEIPVRVTIRSDGYENANVALSINVDGVVADNKSVRLSEDRPEMAVDLSFVPVDAGYKRVRVSITRLDGESTYRNNTDAVSVRVLDSQKRILVLASGPSPDVSALSQILKANTDFDVATFVQKGQRQFYGGADPDSIDSFDLIVLAGFPGSAADPQVLDEVVRASEEGVPILFLAQRNTNLALVASRLSSVLPATPDQIRQDYFDVSWTPSETAANQTLLEGINLSQQEWSAFSPVAQNNSRWRVSPGAVTLAKASVRGIDIEAPLFVSLQRSGRRSIALLASGFWKWQNLPDDASDLSGTFSRLLQNAVQWLTAAEDDRPVRVSPTMSVFAESDRIRFSGQVYDESNVPISDAAVTIEVVAPDGRRIPFNMDASGNGRYQLDAAPLPAGSYSYSVTAKRNEVEIGSDTGSFAVGELALEFRETRANPVLLRQIAQRSGGTPIQETNIARFDDVLRNSESFVTQTETIAQDAELWRRLLFLAVILALLTIEWFIRKRSGLV